MNVELVEALLTLSPEDRRLFQSRLYARQLGAVTHKNLTSTEIADQFREWVGYFPKNSVSLPAEVSQRETIYDDRGT